ncbi:MAG: HAMP domain-containing histidine kinase [Chitinophagaceae bacterium]|nr:HAMP domain-containing histidine kinase [Anaerolineae bacterium]
MTIRKRLTLWYAALLTIIIIFFGTITFGVMRILMIDSIDSTLEETANLISTNSRLHYIPAVGAPPRVDIHLASLELFRASGVYVQAWEIVDGEPVLDSSSENVASYNIPLDSTELGRERPVFSNVRIEGTDLRVLTVPIIQASSGRLVGNIQVAGSLATVNKATETLLFVMIISCILASVGAALLSMWFSHRALAPIEQITQAASKIAVADDLRTRLVWNGPKDELGRLVDVFNHMMTRIEHLFKVQQRFVADISHELRTPLTAIRGNLDIIKRYGLDEDSVNAIESEAQRMSRLVNDLLMLARADYGGMTIDLMPVDMDTIVMESFMKGKGLAQGRDLTIRLAHFEPVRVNGNADRINQLILNLVGNAIKFTPDGGEIIIGLRRQADNAVLWVQDTGIGMPPEVVEHIFERFYQIDPSRAHAGSSFGLGLPIAKWITEAHHGTIKAISEPDKGTLFTVHIPVYEMPTTAPLYEQPTRPRLPIMRRTDTPPIRRPAHEVTIAKPDNDEHHRE